eukprot:10876861-Lingulodinium_polyedra.AAC.1
MAPVPAMVNQPPAGMYAMAANALTQTAGFWAKTLARQDADAARDKGAPRPPRGNVATERVPARRPAVA